MCRVQLQFRHYQDAYPHWTEVALGMVDLAHTLTVSLLQCCANLTAHGSPCRDAHPRVKRHLGMHRVLIWKLVQCLCVIVQTDMG